MTLGNVIIVFACNAKNFAIIIILFSFFFSTAFLDDCKKLSVFSVFHDLLI